MATKKKAKKVTAKKPVRKKKTTSFRTGYKQLRGGRIACLRFPKGTEFVINTFSDVGEKGVKYTKHRASQAKVISITSSCKSKSFKSGQSWHSTPALRYTVDRVVKPHYFDKTPAECSGGIHFFATRKEAVHYDWG